MLLPEHLAHDAPNEFTLYGFTYKTMAHWITVQAKASAGKDFKKYFDKPVNELPPIHRVNAEVLKEGLRVMLPPMKYKKYRYAHTNDRLGIGTTRLRLKFDDPALGNNVYGVCVAQVLKERDALE